MAEIIIKNQNEVAKFVAEFLSQRIIENPQITLGFATGSTPLEIYRELAKIVRSKEIDMSNVNGFALDEYVGLDKYHPQSYYSIIHKYVVEPLRLNSNNVHIPDGNNDISEACLTYEKMIKDAGGIDIQILGIGSDGHIGFNEPGSSLVSRTRIKTLTQQTRSDNARFFDSFDDVPTHCITQGIGTISEAKHLILLAFGKSKADAVAKSVEGALSASCPGSSIQLHPHATVFLDEESAANLENLAYYQNAYANKPKWQTI